VLRPIGRQVLSRYSRRPLQTSSRLISTLPFADFFSCVSFRGGLIPDASVVLWPGSRRRISVSLFPSGGLPFRPAYCYSYESLSHDSPSAHARLSSLDWSPLIAKAETSGFLPYPTVKLSFESLRCPYSSLTRPPIAFWIPLAHLFQVSCLSGLVFVLSTPWRRFFSLKIVSYLFFSWRVLDSSIMVIYCPVPTSCFPCHPRFHWRRTFMSCLFFG